jgi:hypothetical protein
MSFFRNCLRPVLCLSAALLILGAGGALILYGADSTAVPLEIMIPEANGVQLKDGFLSVTVPIGLDPVRRSFSLNLTATGGRHRRLTARVSEPLPQGLVFTLEISSGGFGRSLGPRTIGTAETDLLDGVCLAWRKEVRGTLTARAENIMPRSSGGAELVFSLR